MLLSIREMELHKIHFETTFPPGKIEFQDPKLRQVTPLETRGTAELIEATEEIRVKGHLNVTMATECDRCLEDAAFPIDQDFDLFYRPAVIEGGSHELPIDEGESEMGFYEGSGLELTDLICEQVLLALPMQRTCREDCRGICPNCGQDRNRAQCACQPRPTDDRWAALRDL